MAAPPSDFMNPLPANPDDEAYYRFLFDVSPLPTLVYDLKDFAFLNVNEAAIETYGYAREEFMAATLELLHDPADFLQLKADLAANSLQARQKEIWHHRKKDGVSIPVEI